MSDTPPKTDHEVLMDIAVELHAMNTTLADTLALLVSVHTKPGTSREAMVRRINDGSAA